MRARSVLVRLVPLLLPLLLATALPGQSRPPLELLQTALGRHQVVFLGDIHPFAEPKRLVTALVRGQRPGASIDLLALEVGSEHQPVIDRYLAAVPEDTTVLLAQ